MSPFRERLGQAEALVVHIRRLGGRNIRIAGSIRRAVENPRDIDIVVVNPHVLLMEHIKVLLDDASGKDLKVSGLWRGVHADVVACQDYEYGAMMLYLTGSMRLNIMMRARAKRMGMKLNQYGLWRGEDIVARSTEASIFEHLEMDYLEPEAR